MAGACGAWVSGNEREVHDESEGVLDEICKSMHRLWLSSPF
jgi:hypothetical protein